MSESHNSRILNTYVCCPATSYCVVANTDVKNDATKGTAFLVTMQVLPVVSVYTQVHCFVGTGT